MSVVFRSLRDKFKRDSVIMHIRLLLNKVHTLLGASTCERNAKSNLRVLESSEVVVAMNFVLSGMTSVLEWPICSFLYLIYTCAK